MNLIELSQKLRQIIEKAAQNLDDQTSLDAVTLFPKWSASNYYSAGDKVRYNDVLYKCLTSHTSQDTWKPTDSPSLWAKVLIPDETVIPEWVQPDSTNPYMTGDKVTHNGKTWVSIVDKNVWEEVSELLQ